MQPASNHFLQRVMHAGCCLLLLLCSTAGNSADEKLSSAQDLQYGEALFHYYQQDWFNSIVRLQIAKSQGAMPHHANEAELLLGGLDLSYGLRDEAADIFEQLLAEHRDDLTRNRAWYYLAKISYQRGDPQAALRALAQLDGEMSQGTRAESALLGSLMLLQLGRNGEAIALIESARDAKTWTPYLAYNLGVAQIRSGQLDAGAQTLAAVGSLDGRDEELRTLRDKANLALGYSYLQQGAAKQSRDRLERVRLEGPLSNKALLGTGWADTDAEEFGRALVPWTELGKRNATDPAVQEALLAMPYTLTRMKLHGRAVTQYNSAIDALYSEKDKLNASIKSINNGELLDILQQQDLRSGSGWLQQLTLDTQSPALRYQLSLMAAHDFQEAVKNYRDLQILHNNLEQWAQSMDAYDDMLAARVARFGNNRPAAERALKTTSLAQLKNRYETLAGRVRQAEAGNDPLALANDTETQQWQKLQAIRARLDRHPADAKTTAMRERLQRLEGVLRWQVSTEFKPRLWQAKRDLAALSGLLDQSQQALNNLQHARSDTPEEFSDRARQIRTYRKTIQALLARTGTAQLAQGARLERLAVAELEQQQKRIDTYIVQARFALAQTYDSALHAQAGESQ
jgi:hypothetical protein